MRLALVSLVVPLAAAVATPPPVAAQVKVSPAVGLYMPVGNLVQGNLATGGEIRRQLPAGLIGVRIAAWPNHRFGLEGGITFSPSQVAVTDSLRTVDVTSGVMLASARAFVALGPQAARWSIHLGAGVGVVSRGGRAFDNTSGSSAPALALSAGVRTRMRRTAVQMRFELEDYVLSARFNKGLPSETAARMHHDILWSLGVTVPVF